MITHIGFHYDDIRAVFAKYFYGTKALRDGIAFSRPLYSVLYGIIPGIIGYSAVKWQIFMLLEWWCCSVMFYLFLKNLHPATTRIARWASLLFVVFPAFSQVHIALIYSMGQIIMLMLLGSFIFMERSFHAKRFRTGFFILSLLLMSELFMSEYFFGIEVCRIFFILILVSGEASFSKISTLKNIKLSLVKYTPFAFVIMVFLFWRVFIFKAQYNGTDQYAMMVQIRSHFVVEMTIRLQCLVSDMLILSFFGWTHCFGEWFYVKSSGLSVMIWVVFLTTIFLIVFSFNKLLANKSRSNIIRPDQLLAAKLFVLIGVVIMVISQSIISFSSAHIELGTIWDRYSVAGMFGSCIFISCIFILISKTDRSLTILLSVIVASAAAYQYRNGKVLEAERNYQKDFFYQLGWRAPSVEKGTFLIADQLQEADPYDVPYTMAAVGMSMYGVGARIGKQDYWISDQENTSKGSHAGAFVKGQPIEEEASLLKFEGSYDKSIALWKPMQGCLRVVDSTNKDMIDLSPSRRLDAAVSNASLIGSKRDQAPRVDFLNLLYGKADTNCWCYYFEKAELARQKYDWTEVYDLLNIAQKKKLAPENNLEWLVYLEACIHIKNYPAAATALEKCKGTHLARAYSYNLLQKMELASDATERTRIEEMKISFFSANNSK